MPGPLQRLLEDDHVRLDGWLRRSLESAGQGAIDMESYQAFRAGLLRHIAMEEKVLFKEAARVAGKPLAIAAQLRADHGALASLLVPTPTRDILTAIGRILDEHNPLEEGAGGAYEQCDQLLADQADSVIARLGATPEVPLAPHVDGPRVHDHIANLMRARMQRP
jgi:hypothetical protein